MKQKGKMSGKKLKQMFVTYTFVLPDFIGLLVFIIIPIIYSFYMSLYDWNFANIKQFIGIQNYVTMFSDSEWWQSLGRTFKLTLLYVPALFILSILFAVLINYVKNEKAAGFVKTAFLLPYSITSVIASCLWMFLYMDRSGFINVFLKAFGLKGEKFLGSTSQAMVCIAVVLIWINLGYNIILFLSAIKDIPYSYYEASKTGWSKFLADFLEDNVSAIKANQRFCTDHISDCIVPVSGSYHGNDRGWTGKIDRSCQSVYIQTVI